MPLPDAVEKVQEEREESQVFQCTQRHKKKRMKRTV